jgi:hypothetical protein
MSKKNGLADPSRLEPIDEDDKQLLRVVIETPKAAVTNSLSTLSSTSSS